MILIKYLTRCFVKIAYLVYPSKLVNQISIYYIRIYSLWVCCSLKSATRNVLFKGNAKIRGGEFFNIGANTIFGEHAMLSAWRNYNGIKYTPVVNIGQNCNFGNNVHITSCNRITIGDNVLTGMNVIISDNSHGNIDIESLSIPPRMRPLVSKGEVIIGDNVWIGDKVAVLAGVHIGNNSIIAANAVVTNNIPANCVAGGVPARVIKEFV